MSPCAIASLLALALVTGGCGRAAEQVPAAEGGPTSIEGTSETHAVRGRYEPVAVDRVERLALDSGRIVIHGSATQVAVDAPAAADLERPTRDWALVTEAHVEGKRMLVFTHSESLEEFTLELPDSDAPLEYGVFGSHSGGEVMIFGWGEGSRSYWGHVTLTRAAPAR